MNQYLPPTTTSQVDLEVLQWTNICRTDPGRCAAILENNLQYFHGKLYAPPGGERLETNSGAIAVNGAISFLKTQQPLPAYRWDQYLGFSAKVMCVEQGKTKQFGHIFDGTNPFQRIDHCGNSSGMAGENIAYGGETGG